jgi:hypothetical protein
MKKVLIVGEIADAEESTGGGVNGEYSVLPIDDHNGHVGVTKHRFIDAPQL